MAARKQEPGQIIRTARKSAKMSQFALAVRAGLSLPTVSLAERTGFFTKRTAEVIAGALGIPLESLADGYNRPQGHI